MLSLWDLDGCQKIYEPLSAHRHYQPFVGVASISVEETTGESKILTPSPRTASSATLSACVTSATYPAAA